MLTHIDRQEHLRRRLHDELDTLEPSPALLDAARVLQPRHRRPGWAVTAAVAASVALLVGLVVTTGGSGSPVGPAGGGPAVDGHAGTVRLFGRRVALPAGYRLTGAVSDGACTAWLRSNVDGSPGRGFSFVGPVPVDEWAAPAHALAGADDALTLSVSGGAAACLQTSVSVPYRLPSAVTPTTPFVSAAQARHLPTAPTPTTVDGSYAEVVPVTASVLEPTRTITTGPGGSSATESTPGTRPGGEPTMPGVLLFVRVADGDGRYQLVAVLAWDLPAATVVGLAGRALAAGPPPVPAASAGAFAPLP